MNIKITYKWLLEYLNTDADPYEMQKYLSLSGPGVERVDKVGDDYVFDIEVTTNRIDMASVFGIAQEAQAILPQFDKQAKLTANPLGDMSFADVKNPDAPLPFECVWEQEGLASRTSFIVLDEVAFGPSPKQMQDYLAKSDVRPLNNLVDVTNYIMIALGQPAHVFDYDKIAGHKLTLRLSRKGESITTLDGKTVKLPGGDMVMEDGDHRLVDLCGIMGGLDTAVDQNTKRVVLFTQTYNKKRVRNTSMKTGARSTAATYFEKGLDEERTEPALVYGVKLLKEIANARIASPIIDHYPHPKKAAPVSVSQEFITSRIGVDIPTELSVQILTNLGFDVVERKHILKVTPSAQRKYDIAIPEDLVEEIARIYGYHNLPNQLPPAVHVEQPRATHDLITHTSRIKHYLSHLGLHEQMNYSMISHEMITGLGLDPANHLKLANSTSSQWQYMRTSLIPSLIQNMRDNYGKKDRLEFFELSKVYYPQPSDLPKEVWKLTLATNTSFEDLKGIIEALLGHLMTPTPTVEVGNIDFFAQQAQVDFKLGDIIAGSMGRLTTALQHALDLKQQIFLASFDVQTLIDNTGAVRPYRPINPYATIKRDLTLEAQTRPYQQIVQVVREATPLLQSVAYLGSYEGKISLRLYFSSHTKNITEQEVGEELEKIKTALKQTSN